MYLQNQAPSKMTDYSKVTINDIWQQRKFNSFSRVHSDSSPTSNGLGIFVKTKQGDIIFDLRSARERFFLGHFHPLLTKRKNPDHQRQNYIYNREIADQIPSLLRYNDKDEVFIINEKDWIENKEVLLGIIGKIDREITILEENLSLIFPHKQEVYPNTKINRASLMTPLDCIVSPQPLNNFKETDKNFPIAFSKHFDRFWDSIMQWKWKSDHDLLKQYLTNSALTEKVRLEGRTLILPLQFQENLQMVGILGSQVGENIMLSYPFACTNKEILDSLELIKSTIQD